MRALWPVDEAMLLMGLFLILYLINTVAHRFGLLAGLQLKPKRNTFSWKQVWVS